MDGFHKLSRMAEEVFGEDIFNTGNKKENKKEIEQGIIYCLSNCLVHLHVINYCTCILD